MFAIVQNNQVVQMIPNGSGFTLDGIQYPPQWIPQSTPEQRAAIGLVDVVYVQMPNDQYYWVTQNAPVYNPATNQVDVTFTATPKDLDQLKANQVSQINQTAYTILLPSDWMVVKAVETQGTVAPEWNTWRAEIRSQADAGRVAVEACTTVEELVDLPSIDWARDPNQPPIEEIPIEVQPQ